MATAKKPKSLHPGRGRIVLLVVFLLLLYVVVPQLGGFSDSLVVLKGAELAPVWSGVPMIVATYVAAAGMYTLLAFRRLRFIRTLAVQGAGAFANRVLPAGIGGLALNVRYLRKAGHTLPQAIAVAGANNLVGFIGHILLLITALIASGAHVGGRLVLPDIGYGWYIALAVAIIVGAALLVLKRARRYIGKMALDAATALLAYRRRVLRLCAALACSLALTLLTVGAFYLSAVAVGASLSPVQALVIFTLGMALGTATPTPGGLGGVEAGLMAGSVAFGESASVALAAALLYRLLTYWLPLLPGFALFVAVRKQYL